MRHTIDTPRGPGHGRGHWHHRHGHHWEGRHGDREERSGKHWSDAGPGVRHGRGDTPGTEPSGHWGRHGGRGHRGGRGGRPHVGKGDVRAALLLLLDEQPLHGYQLIHRIEERSGGLWRPSPGSVYPALQLLEDEGLVRPEQEEGRRVLHLTDAGKAYVAERRSELEAARNAVTGSVNPKAHALQELIQQLTVAVDQVTQVGTSAQLDLAHQSLVATRRQLYRILADDVPASEQPATTNTTGDIAL